MSIYIARTQLINKLVQFMRIFPTPSILKKFWSMKLLENTGDLVGYETLIEFIKRYGLIKLEGDFIEIGSFVGGGTSKLARFSKKFGKTVYAIDIFDISADKQKNVSGAMMSDLYSLYLQRLGMSQYQAYQIMIRDLTNIVTIRNDSMKVIFPTDKKFMFGFIDGNHAPKYIMNDFYLIWQHLVSGGVVAFHDYGGDLPLVTKTIDFIISKHEKEINKIVNLPEKKIIFIIKRNGKKVT